MLKLRFVYFFNFLNTGGANERKKIEMKYIQESKIQEQLQQQQELLKQAKAEELLHAQMKATVTLDPLEDYDQKHNSTILHAHTACMLIQATYRR